MITSKGIASTDRSQLLSFLGVSLAVAGLTGILWFNDDRSFQAYFGDLNPLIAIFLIILLGTLLISYLLARGWFVVYSHKTRTGVMLSAGIAAALAVIIIAVDSSVKFPESLNVAFPQSVLFYPAIGFVVEIIFHLLPLSLLLFVLTSLFKKADQRRLIWLCILIVSFLEPVFQTLGFVGLYPVWAVTYVALHVFLINLIQLSIFRRYDFISMYAFRLAYYLLWHIVWGYVRLKVLF